MNVLMLGWEFPPNTSGGLGTACEGIVKGLSAFDDVHVLFVVPKSSGNENTTNFELIDAENIATTGKVGFTEQTHVVIEVPSNLFPYVRPEDFSKTKHFHDNEIPTNIKIETSGAISFRNEFHFTRQYGTRLFDEIKNYAIIAEIIAKNNQFGITPLEAMQANVPVIISRQSGVSDT